MSLQQYKKQSLSFGWTRIEMLLEVYDHAITALEGTQVSLQQEDQAAFAKHYVAAQKAMLAIHSGLEPHKDQVAYNVACLLHFAIDCCQQRKFADAIKVLQELRSGFAAVAEEVNQLERDGTLPPVPDRDCFQQTA
jgi:flagellin-specific chaperone FliS